MNYKLTIVKLEPNENYDKEIDKISGLRGYSIGYNNTSDIPQRKIVRDVLNVEITEEQYKAVKLEVLKVF